MTTKSRPAATASPPATMALPEARPTVLCVDDEPNLLAALVPHLRRVAHVITAPGGAAALEHFDKGPIPAVVISDMRMPVMDGATLLANIRARAPDTVRILLTGHTDLDSAIVAVNEGQIFRFLTKPCPPAVLQTAVSAAIAQHRLITAERVLLDQTLRGSVQAMTDILAITSPLLFGRAQRIRRLATELVVTLGVARRWQLEVAAMLSQIGWVGLPPTVAEKVHAGRLLAANEADMVARAPALTRQLLAHIPRLEDVCTLLEDMHRPWHRGPRPASAATVALHVESQVLRVAAAWDSLETLDRTPDQAYAAMCADTGSYDPDVLAGLATLRLKASAAQSVTAVPIHALEPGMVLQDDLRLANGSLLASRGYTVTEAFLERLANFGASLGANRINVLAAAAPSAAVTAAA